MKSLVLGGFLLLSNMSFAQVDFDYKAERLIVEQESKQIVIELDDLYKRLYDENGQERPEIKAQIEAVSKNLDVLAAKSYYLSSIGFEKLDQMFSESRKLRHFKSASNRYASVIAKDSQGQILFHESVDKFIGVIYDQDVAKKYGCYESDESKEPASLPYEEEHAKYITGIMNQLGYKSYEDLRDQSYKTFCSINEVVHEESASIPECNDFLSGVRISLLETIENKAIAARKAISKTGYFKTSDEQFLQYDVLKDLQYDIEEQIKNIEALCLDHKLNDNDKIFNYLESEVEKDGISVEYSNFKLPNIKVNKQ